MDLEERPDTMKRRRSNSNSMEEEKENSKEDVAKFDNWRLGSSPLDIDDSDDAVSDDKMFKPWNDPAQLEEMGVGILGNEEFTTDEGEVVKESPDRLSSSSDDFCENIDVNKEGEDTGRARKKRKLTNGRREPLKEQQVLAVSEIERSPQHRKEDGVKLEKLKPESCIIKNSQVLYEKEELSNTSKEEASNVSKEKDAGKKCCGNKLTEELCNEEFKLSRKSLKNRNSETGEDYFSRLPEELILEILKKLDRGSVVRCCLVSRRLNRVAVDESLWSRVDLGGRSLPSGCLAHIMRRGPFILRLASACIPGPVSLPRQLPKNFSCKIQYLDLSMAAISQESLAKFLGYCKRIKKLSVENCVISDDVAFAIADNRGLEVLNMAMCTGVTASGIVKIVTQCTRLQSLNLGWTSLTGAAISMLCRKIPLGVERLNISGCRKNISDENVIDILERCDNLLELDISDCIDLTERTIRHIVDHVSSLEYLAISRCYSIPLDCLPELKKVDSLIYLDLFGICSDWELKQMKASLKEKTLNQFMFSSVARPTVGLRRSSIWGLRVRD